MGVTSVACGVVVLLRAGRRFSLARKELCVSQKNLHIFSFETSTGRNVVSLRVSAKVCVAPSPVPLPRKRFLDAYFFSVLNT